MRSILVTAIMVFINAFFATGAWIIHVVNEPDNRAIWIMAIIQIIAVSFMFVLIPNFKQIENERNKQ